VTSAVVTTVKILGIPGQQLPHNGGYALFATTKQEMDVVVHEDPSVYRTVALTDVLAKAIKE